MSKTLLHFWGSICLETHLLWCSRLNLDSSETKTKQSFQKRFTPILKLLVPIVNSFDFFRKVSSKSIYFFSNKDVSNEELSTPYLASEAYKYGNPRFSFRFASSFVLFCLRSYNVQFSHRGFNSKLYTCGENFDWKVDVSDAVILFLTVRKSKKMQNDLSQLSNSDISRFDGSLLSIKVFILALHLRWKLPF